MVLSASYLDTGLQARLPLSSHAIRPCLPTLVSPTAPVIGS